MAKMHTVSENPNPKVATIAVDIDLLGGKFSKVIVPKNSDMVQYSPLAQAVFEHVKDCTRVDFTCRDGQTLISVARKLVEWTPQGTAQLQSLIAQISKQGPILYPAAIAQTQQARKPFDPGNNPVKKLVSRAFAKHASPILARDGGDMELLNVRVEKTGEIFAEVALMGSCNSCSMATTSTLKGATEVVNAELVVLKGNMPGNPNVQRLNFGGIQTKEMPSYVYER